MAKRQPKKTPYKPYQISKGIVVAVIFLLSAAFGILFIGTIFSLVGFIEHPYRDTFIGFSIPCAFILFYRWRAGKWFDPNDPPED